MKRRSARRWKRAGDMMKAGQGNPAFSSVLKYYGTELNKRRHELLMSAGGTDALEWESERSGDGARARNWLRTKANSIEGGTSEVQLNIVAKRILGPARCMSASRSRDCHSLNRWIRRCRCC